jgi:hypothetical protein
MSYVPVLIHALFFGVAAGNIWSAPFIGRTSPVGWLIVALGMYLPARLQSAQRYQRTAMVAALAWPVAFLWQSIHYSSPNLLLGSIQAAVLIVSSQGAAWVAERRVARSDPTNDAA